MQWIGLNGDGIVSLIASRDSNEVGWAISELCLDSFQVRLRECPHSKKGEKEARQRESCYPGAKQHGGMNLARHRHRRPSFNAIHQEK